MIKNGLLVFLLLFGLNNKGLSAPSTSVETMPPVLQRLDDFEDRPPVEEPVAESFASPEYCSHRGRPKDNEAHLRFSVPSPDPLYKSNNLLKLPNTPGEVHISVNPGQSYVYKFRFKSELLKYPVKTKMNLFRIPGYEDKYPQMATWNCDGATSGIQSPMHGVSVMLWRGDNGGGSLAGYNVIHNQGGLPPFDDTRSGVYGFSYTPTLSQAGQTMEIRLVAQSGVTGVERDFQSIYESDQALYKIILHVDKAILPSVFYTSSVNGLNGNVELEGNFTNAPQVWNGSISYANVLIDDVIRVEFFVDGLFVSSIPATKTEIPGFPYLYSAKHTFSSNAYLDGLHQFYVKGYTQQGHILTSPVSLFRILNNAPSGPAPLIFDARRLGMITASSPVLTLKSLRTEFYQEGGSYLGLGYAYSVRNPEIGIALPKIPGNYAYYAVVYYNDGTRGISDILRFTVY